MGFWGSCSNIPEAIFYLLKGDYIDWELKFGVFKSHAGFKGVSLSAL